MEACLNDQPSYPARHDAPGLVGRSPVRSTEWSSRNGRVRTCLFSKRIPNGFTLIELLVVLVIVALLTSLGFMGVGRMRSMGGRIACASNLRQLGAATHFYMVDHEQFPPYLERTPDGNIWYFGRETTTWLDGESQRNLEPAHGPLGPYLAQAGGVTRCPAFNYGSAVWKPKYTTPSWGYGYNWRLGGGFGGKPMRMHQVKNAANTILFGDSAQINTFQAPASPENPMLEEFYIIDEKFRTIHFRHGGQANMLFIDGSVRSFAPEPGTLDSRLPSAAIGRITPVGSTEMLE